MSSSFEKHQKRRLISSYFSVVISIALVLFLLGTLGLLVLNAKSVSDNLKEQVILTIYLEDSSKEVEIKQLEKSLAFSSYVKKTSANIAFDKVISLKRKTPSRRFVYYFNFWNYCDS